MLDKIVNDPKQKLLAAEKSFRVIVMYPMLHEPVVVVEPSKEVSYPFKTESALSAYLKQSIVYKQAILKNEKFLKECEKYIALAWYVYS